MATIRKRTTGSWEASVRKKGHSQVYKSFKTKAAAERWAREVETEIERGSFISTHSADTTIFHDVIDRYLAEVLPTKKSQRQVISQANGIRKELGQYSISALSPPILAQYRDKRLRGGHRTHCSEKTCFSFGACLRMRRKNGKYTSRVEIRSLQSRVPTQPKGRERRLVDDEEERIA